MTLGSGKAHRTTASATPLMTAAAFAAYCPANETVFNGTCSSDWYLCSGAVDFPFGFSLKSLDVSCLANVTSMNVDTVFEITEIVSNVFVFDEITLKYSTRLLVESWT